MNALSATILAKQIADEASDKLAAAYALFDVKGFDPEGQDALDAEDLLADVHNALRDIEDCDTLGAFEIMDRLQEDFDVAEADFFYATHPEEAR